MKLLLDTHTILWFWWDDPRLGAKAREAIENAGNQKLVSIAAPWEVAIKVSLKKLDLGGPFHHRDPFDRLLIAQGLAEDMPIVSRETVFDLYGVHRIWG
jgi:PIN domain nuclease of toxin-antitoxin system